MQELKQDQAAEMPAENLPLLEEMMKAGLFLGHQKSKTHPRMRSYIFTTRNGMEVIDLPQTLAALEKALEFIKTKLANKGTLLLVGTAPAARAAVEEFGKKLNLPYVANRWLGGTLTNYKTLSKRISYFKKLKADRQAGRFDKYTKKERLEIDREINKLTEKFTGIDNMESLPEILFVIDISAHEMVVREGKRMKIPVVALVNTDANPDLVDYPIPVNDRSRSSVEWILGRLETAIAEARKNNG